MNKDMLFQQMNFIRKRTIAALDATSKELILEIPNGFKNNLLWNFGHIFWAQEVLLHSFVNEKHTAPQNWQDLFQMDSKPQDWEIEPPPLIDIRSSLVEQPNRIIETFSGRLFDIGDKPFNLGPETQLNTLAEVLAFVNWHEGLHQGTINSIKRALGVEDLWKIEDNGI